MILSKSKNKMLIISVVWLLTVAIHMTVELLGLKFPTVEETANIVILAIMLILPILSIVFSLVPQEHLQRTLNVILIVAFVVQLFYISFVTLGFSTANTGFYLITVSETEKPENYLVLDKINDDEAVSKVNIVFPKEIPDDATEVQYTYRCVPHLQAWDISASWQLPRASYENELKRIETLSSRKYVYDGVVYYDLSDAEDEDSYCHVGFDDENNTIDYVYVLRFYRSDHKIIDYEE